MIYQVVSIVLPLFFIVAVGYLYGLFARPAMGATNQLVVDVFIPALILSVVLRQDFYPSQYIGLVFASSAIIIGSGFFAYFFSKCFDFKWRAFVPVAMFSNWANLGVPLYVLALGEHALSAGVMIVVAGNILFFTIGTYIYSGKLSKLEVLKNPVLLSVILGLVINQLNVAIPKTIMLPIEMMGKVAIPLMLISLGVRLTRVNWSQFSIGVVQAVFSPVVGVMIALCITSFFGFTELQRNVLILFGALPPAVINFMLAEQYDAYPEQVASMVLISNAFALITIPIVLYFFI